MIGAERDRRGGRAAKAIATRDRRGGIAAALMLAIAASVAGCNAPSNADIAVDRAAIVGGAPEADTPAVVAIVPVVPTCGEPSAPAPVVCTGTLIAPRVVLTAAHCVQSAANAQVLAAVFADDVAHAPADAQIRVVEGRIHPAWTAGAHDLGALILAADAPVAPLAFTGAPPPAVGALVRVVGFGLDDQGALGTRRSGTAQITALDAGSFAITAAPAMSCGGDSGGPVLDANAARIVGVTSFGDAACTTGTNMRVDLDAAFIASIVDDVSHAPPTRPAFDPAADACAAPCRDHADCPIGMACVAGPDATSTCAVAGFAAGHFGPACTGPDGDRPCLSEPDAAAACRQWLPCTSPSEGGCATSNADGAWALLVVLALLESRRIE